MPTPASEPIAQILHPRGAPAHPSAAQAPPAATSEPASTVVARILDPQPSADALAAESPILETEDPSIVVV